MMRTTKPFLKVYLARATARVQEALHIMGVESNSKRGDEKEGGEKEKMITAGNLTLAKQVPSEKEVATYIECVRHELRTVRHDVELTNHLVRHVVLPSLHALSDYLHTCRCMHSDVTNFDMTIFGSSRSGSGVDGGRENGSSGAFSSSSSSSSSSPSAATTTSMHQQQQGRRRASLNSFQRHNCKLAFCTKTIVISLDQMSKELENELESSTVSMKRAATWSTTKMLQYRQVSFSCFGDTINAVSTCQSSHVQKLFFLSFPFLFFLLLTTPEFIKIFEHSV